ncbi:hypothetical protein [Microbacterium sp.]|uniref:hypothetical protein n=1 Tax=Microbacterium sp. TaxID=51671 RepID=UPI003341F6FB
MTVNPFDTPTFTEWMLTHHPDIVADYHCEIIEASAGVVASIARSGGLTPADDTSAPVPFPSDYDAQIDWIIAEYRAGRKISVGELMLLGHMARRTAYKRLEVARERDPDAFAA